MTWDNRFSLAWVRCYQELGERLPSSCRGRCFPVSVQRNGTLAALLALLELPLDEVDLALINSRSAGFSHPVHPGDRVSLYPVFESLNITSLSALRPRPLRNLRFLADTGLEDLAALLVQAGQDVRAGHGLHRDELARTSRETGRVLLTLDPELIRGYNLEKAYLLRSSDAGRQLGEVLRRFDLE